MEKLDHLINLWIISLLIIVAALPAIADGILITFGLPFILSNMLVAAIFGALVGHIQSHLLKPFVTIPRWRSNTAIAAVCGAFFVGALSIFADSASSLGITMDVPLVYLLVMVAIVQAKMLPKHASLRILWVLPYFLLSLFVATQLYIGAILAAMASMIPLMLLVWHTRKRKKDTYHHAVSRLSDVQDEHDQEYAANVPCSLKHNSLS